MSLHTTTPPLKNHCCDGSAFLQKSSPFSTGWQVKYLKIAVTYPSVCPRQFFQLNMLLNSKYDYYLSAAKIGLKKKKWLIVAVNAFIPVVCELNPSGQTSSWAGAEMMSMETHELHAVPGSRGFSTGTDLNVWRMWIRKQGDGGTHCPVFLSSFVLRHKRLLQDGG